MRYCWKYGTAGQATDDNIIRRMRTVCRIIVATNTERICNMLAFPWQNYYANTPPRYVIHTSVYMSLIYTSKCLLFLQLFHEKTFVIINRNLVIKSACQVLPVSLEVLCNIRTNKQPSYFVSMTERNFYGSTNVVPSIQQALLCILEGAIQLYFLMPLPICNRDRAPRLNNSTEQGSDCEADSRLASQEFSRLDTKTRSCCIQSTPSTLTL